MYTKSYRPNHRVTLKRANNNYKEEDISNDILSIRTTKVYGRAAGAFTLILTFATPFNGKRYDQAIKPNDIVLIELDAGEGAGLQKVMIGLVNRPARVREVDQSGKPTRQVQISGMDFGKLLIKNNCGWNVAPMPDHIGSEQATLLAAAGFQVSGTPAQLVEKLMDIYFFQQFGPWVTEYVSMYPAGKKSDNWQTFDMSITERSGSAWSALKGAENAPYNTLTTETDRLTGKFYVTLEKTPFDNETGKIDQDLRQIFYEFDDRDVVKENIGQCDDERINYIFFKTHAGIFAEKNGFPLLFLKGPALKYDEESVHRHGFIPFYPDTVFTPFQKTKTPLRPTLTDAGQLGDVQVETTKRTEAFWNWYRNNEEYENGSFVVHGRPEVPAGAALLKTDSNFEYFAEQIDHTYVAGEVPIFQTTFGVTRGQDHGR